MKHTKGPWLLADGDSTFIYALHTDGFNRFQLQVQGNGDVPRKELEANARLIATAPELLEACKHVLMEKQLHGHCVDSATACRKAITKAEGV